MKTPSGPQQAALATALAGALGSTAAAAAPLSGAQTTHLAFAHDYLLGGERPPVHLMPSVPTQFDDAGVLRGFSDGGPVHWAAEQAVGHSGNDGLIAWGRWGHGHIGGTGKHGGYDITGGEGARNALYYVAGIPAGRQDSGAYTYALLGGGVAPTAGEGGMAATTALDSGRLHANFATGRVDVELTLTVPSGTYALTANGLRISDGLLTPDAQSEVKVTGVFCFAGCRGELRGFLAGPSAQRIGLAYHIDVEALSEDPNGVVAWTREGGADP